MSGTEVDSEHVRMCSLGEASRGLIWVLTLTRVWTTLLEADAKTLMNKRVGVQSAKCRSHSRGYQLIHIHECETPLAADGGDTDFS